MKKRLGYMLVLLVLAGAAIGYWLYARNTPDVVRTAPDMVVTADALAAAFSRDAAAADRRFNGKVIAVLGTVKSIDASGAVVLQGSSDALEVVAGFDDRHRQDAAKLRAGMNAALQGVYSGYEKSAGDAGDLLAGLGTTIHLRSAGLAPAQ